MNRETMARGRELDRLAYSLKTTVHELEALRAAVRTHLAHLEETSGADHASARMLKVLLG